MSDANVYAYGPTLQISRELLADMDASFSIVDYLRREAAVAIHEAMLDMRDGPRLGPGRNECDKYRKRRRTVHAYRHRDRREDLWD